MNTDLVQKLRQQWAEGLSGSEAWQAILPNLRKDNRYRDDFALHLALYHATYPDRQQTPAPAWIPDAATIAKANITRWQAELNFPDYPSLQRWSHVHFTDFWQRFIEQIELPLQAPYSNVADLRQGVEKGQWLPDCQLNIAQSCFTAAPDAIAIIYQDADDILHRVTYQQLDDLSNRIANSLHQQGFTKGDALAIDMTMNIEAVALYLGIIKAGCVVVSIADSFAASEVQTRLDIAKAKAIFVHDVIVRGTKTLPLYEKILSDVLPPAIVIPVRNNMQCTLRAQDCAWQDFLVRETHFSAEPCAAEDMSNLLFSSGTTGTPKAIPWTHTTPLKCASDAFFHQDIHPGDVLAWPTNLGWMMGPWLIYAALMNKATIALYGDSPNTRRFGQFIANSKTTMLGVVPSLVKNWRSTNCMADLDWSNIQSFSSSGECSNPDDMLYLMFLGGYKPVIEYCGGTEIGGAYVSSSITEANVPSLFSTATMGLAFAIIDDEGLPTENGHVALIPPSIGLSTRLLNRDHHQEYYAGVKSWQDDLVLRRHGDKINTLGGYYRLEGRTDDTMNLGGVKTSSAEIERVLNQVGNVLESAAIGVAAHAGGPQNLIVYITGPSTDCCTDRLHQQLQQAIKSELNPLFKIERVFVLTQLPKTASNKIMRKVLRAQYETSER